MEPQWTRGLNFFATAITKHLNFYKIFQFQNLQTNTSFQKFTTPTHLQNSFKIYNTFTKTFQIYNTTKNIFLKIRNTLTKNLIYLFIDPYVSSDQPHTH